MATEEQLKKRWLTAEGKKIKREIVDHIKEDDWKRFLVDFPFIDEVKNGKDLRYIDLCQVNLAGADLAETHLIGAKLKGANLIGANLKEAILKKARLREAIITSANLESVHLEKANLGGAKLMGSYLRGAYLTKAILKRSNLLRTNLKESDLNEANLGGANLTEAKLGEAKLNNATLKGSCINRADLSGADLTGANIYGISAWGIITDEKTVMKNLIINSDPLITVDDIEIAQFIYMISNNKKIRNVIDTMRTKGVLILGSFDDKTKPILNMITDVLKENNLIPMIFYFERPMELSLMNTVKTMALLSKFVIVDLSIRSGQYSELENLHKDIRVPYATIAFEDTNISGMLSELKHYYWCKHPYFPYPQTGWENTIPMLVKDTIIPWADGINEELRKRNDR